mmetsp:Transcript_71391/g.87592  ORF Transcript_71391/g.87592 Transcript_71391/m.87592 type:complete len:134 (-) Transcript_71391:237-638(-)
MASRFGASARGFSRRMHFNSTNFRPNHVPHQSSYQSQMPRMSSAFQSTYLRPTMTMTQSDIPMGFTQSTICLTCTMEHGSHLVGVGSTSSGVSDEDEEDDGQLISYMFMCKSVLQNRRSKCILAVQPFIGPVA